MKERNPETEPVLMYFPTLLMAIELTNCNRESTIKLAIFSISTLSHVYICVCRCLANRFHS